MPQNRKKSRQQPPSALTSDYESDTAAFTDTQPFIPAPPLRSNTELNLLVLRRWQPEITNILTIAPFAVLYIFSPELGTWEKCEVQGSLFLCSLTRSPAGHSRYRLIILNRKGLENWTHEVNSEDAVQLTEEYVIVQKVDPNTREEQIYGIWIFEDKDGNTRDIVGRAIVACAREVEAMDGEAGVEGLAEDEVTFEEQQYASQEGHAYGQQPGQDQWPRDEAAHPQQQFQIEQFQQEGQMQQPQEPQGQSIDLATLFGKPTAAPSVQPPQTEVNIGGTVFTSNPFAEERLAQATAVPNYNIAHRFPPSADTDFFRGAGPPAQQNLGHQQPQPTAQQNTLLDLFKNAKK